MKRRPISRKKSRKKFIKGKRVHKKNLRISVSRGGFKI